MAIGDLLARMAGDDPAPPPDTLDGTLREVRRVAVAFPADWRTNAAYRAELRDAMLRAVAAGATEAEIALAILKA